MLLKLTPLFISMLLFSGATLNGELQASWPQKQRLSDFVADQVAKAQKGERPQLQQLACELDYGTATVQYHAIKKLGSIGGWFSISSLTKLLADEPRYTVPAADSYAIYGSLQFQALQVLPSMVSNPPIPKGQPIRLENTSSEAGIWRNWLSKNHDAISQLQPIGEGVVADEKVCREVLKSDLSNTAYPPRKKSRHALKGQPQ